MLKTHMKHDIIVKQSEIQNKEHETKHSTKKEIGVCCQNRVNSLGDRRK